MDLGKWIDVAFVLGCAVIGKKVNDAINERDQAVVCSAIEVRRLQLEIEHMKKKQELEDMKKEIEAFKKQVS